MDEIVSFLIKLLERLRVSRKEICQVELASPSGEILYSESSTPSGQINFIAKSVISNKVPIFSENREDPTNMRYYQPVIFDYSVQCVLITSGAFDAIQSFSEIVCESLEAFCAFNASQNNSSSSSNAKLIRSLIFETPDRQNLLESFSIFQTTHDSVYSVILLRIDFPSQRYFNIDLELGYYTSYSAMRASVLNAVKNNKYITQRDYYAFTDDKHIVIIKSLLDHNDVSKLYLALATISKAILDDVRSVSPSIFHVSYGLIFKDIQDAAVSYKDACSTMRIGMANDIEGGVHDMVDLVFQDISEKIHPQITNKIFLPAIQSLTNENGEFQASLLRIAEQYVDCCMHIAPTAEKLFFHRNTVKSKLNRFTEQTGLDPTTSYRDSFLVKMLAMYVRKTE